MFDFYNYLNSPDISRHLRKIGYAFTAPEAAWVVFNSQRSTLEEKHRAYNAIINELPDDFGGGEVGIHECLQGLMNAENEAVELFKADTNAEGKPFVYTHGQGEWTIDWMGIDLFATFDECFVAARRWGMTISESNVRLRKMFYGNNGGWIDLVVRVSDGAVMDVDCVDCNRKLGDLKTMFFGVAFDFPVPFKRGDILIEPESGAYVENTLFLDIGTRNKDGNLLTMHLYGLRVGANGDVVEMDSGEYGAGYGTYTNFEYLPTSELYTIPDICCSSFEPSHVESSLLALRQFERGEIDEVALCKKYANARLGTLLAEDPSCEEVWRGAPERKEWGVPFVKLWVDESKNAPCGYIACTSAEQAIERIKQCKQAWLNVDLVDMRDPRVCGEFACLLDFCGDVDVRFHGGDINDSWRLKKRKNSHDEYDDADTNK